MDFEEQLLKYNSHVQKEYPRVVQKEPLVRQEAAKKQLQQLEASTLKLRTGAYREEFIF